MQVKNQIDPFLYRSFSRQEDYTRKLENQKNKNGFSNLLEQNKNILKEEPIDKIKKNITADLYSKIGTSNFQLRVNRETITREIAHSEDKKKIYDAAKSFEAFFLEKVFKEMKKNQFKEKLIDGGFAEEVFDEMLLTERVGQMSNQQEFGLAEMIYHQMSRR